MGKQVILVGKWMALDPSSFTDEMEKYLVYTPWQVEVGPQLTEIVVVSPENSGECIT